MKCLDLKVGSSAVVIDNSVCGFRVGEIVRFVSREEDIDGSKTNYYYTFINRNNIEEQLTREEFEPVEIRVAKPKRIRY
ncbi:hypothetical protein [Bacillus sp. RIT 809]|uniref:hypothetical protein n=1 Tax=Bacillus sp. RIT 809 TaxID=2803857 RepID=UPI00194F51EF|nr:hypothetical protein [Bacillus sp. RIT 809]MBM6645112.1 hypothetical protein [Bacillus sp. RIT 809]